MKIKIKLNEEMLGMSSANPQVHEEFIASKSGDADKIKEELEALPAEDLMEKAVTVFPRDEDGCPILWDYQFKGFLKESIHALLELAILKSCKIGEAKLSRWTSARVFDNGVFVYPRKIRLNPPEGTEIYTKTRPLRAKTMKGDRVALASSECLAAGTTLECEIKVLNKSLEPLIVECLNYGAFKGLGQWRNSGAGRFEWVEVKEKK